jgi:hypothetical protein
MLVPRPLQSGSELPLQLHKNVGRIANPSLKYRAIPIEVGGRQISRFVMSGREAENWIWHGNRRIGNPSYEEVYATLDS